jgi:iron complex outermembrane recepter protein
MDRLERIRLDVLACSVSIALASVAHADDNAAPAGGNDATTSEVGTITVQGAAGGPDQGLIQPEDSPKSRSSVSKQFIEKQVPTANPFQLLSLLPGVSVSDQDGTGLTGSTLRVRGFNSNQMGVTLDGAPLNDSLNYTINIQEYADPENLCNAFLTQGSTDIDAPHVGSSGGNIGITTCDPKDEFGGLAETAFGSDHFQKYFFRVDSGKVLDGRAKFFVSASKAKVDQFTGFGNADRDHFDAKGVFDFGGGSYSKVSMLYNRMINANYRTLSKADIARGGLFQSFGNVPPVHQPPGPGVQNDTTFAPNAGIFGSTGNGYYGFNNNPFENYQISAVNHIQLTPKASIDFNPYYIWGYGTGGNQLAALKESSGQAALHGGTGDVNGDGDTLDTVGVYSSSVSETNRVGATLKLNYQLGIHALTAGIWHDAGHSVQTSPVVSIDDNGGTSDFWLRNQSDYLRYEDGTPIMLSRNYDTTIQAQTLFLQDAFSVLHDRLSITAGIKRQSVQRSFSSLASGIAGANAGGADYHLEQRYNNILGDIGLRYQLTDNGSVYFNAGQNARAPQNNANANLLVLGGPDYHTSVVNGVMVAKDDAGNPVPLQLAPSRVSPEKSNNFELGYRYASNKLTFSSAAFYDDFQNRIATDFDPDSGLTTEFNAGKSRVYGLELESGYLLNSHWSVYGSLSYTRSEMLEDSILAPAVTAGGTPTNALLPTSGKQFPDTPNWLGALSVQYATSSWYAFLRGHYIGKRYTSLVNDDSISGYAIFDFGAGYRFPKTGFAKSPMIRFNISNLFDKRYLSMTGPSGETFTNNVHPIVTPNGTIAGNLNSAGVPTAPQFFIGAPRSFQVAFSTEF